MSLLLLKNSFTVLLVGTVAAYLLQAWWLRKVKRARVPWVVSGGALLLIWATWYLAERASLRERHRVKQTMESFARLYGLEMEAHGHWKLSSDAAQNDPLYLELIELEKRWLSLNTVVSDIYTFRKRSDGKNVLIVDSETDYDHNGKYEGEREQRTPLGEVYPQENPALERALAGHANFDGEPYSDRWGTWVSAFVPIYDPQGKQDGVLGVDFEADQLLHSIVGARVRVVFMMAFAQVLLLGASTLTSALKADDRDRRKALDALHLSEQHFRQVVYALPTALYTCDKEGRITLYNQAAAQLWGREPQLGLDRWTGAARISRTNGTEILPGKGPMSRALQTGESTRGEEVIVERPDGQRAYVLSYAEPIRKDGGEIVGAVKILVDLTERRAAELRLAEANKKLLELSREAGAAEVATSVLHNVGNVLNSANISLEIATGKLVSLRTEALTRLAALLTEHSGDLAGFVANTPQGKQLSAFLTQLAQHFENDRAAVREELSSLRRHIEHINEIIAMQQSFAARREVLEEVPLGEVIEDALSLNCASLDRHGAEVVRDFDSSVPPFPIDRHRLIQILVNLIQNAKQSMAEAGLPEKRLTLRTDGSRKDRVAIMVSDTGPGIPPENLPRLFEHGFTTRRHGHGFGLHASALAAREMGATLTVANPGAKRGATFVLELPVPTASTTPTHN